MSASEGKNKKDKIYWVPLESSPQVMNKIIEHMGVGASVKFDDVYDFDEEILSMVAQPVHALVFLFPEVEGTNIEREREAQSSKDKVSPNIWHMRQTIGNACGTMAIFHALGNNQKTLPIGGNIAAFFDKVNGLSPEDKAKELEQSKEMEEAHRSGASEDQSAAPEADADVDYHYVALTIVDGDLYEIDGGLSVPINHGPATDVLRDGVRVAKRRIAAMEDKNIGFSLIALSSVAED
ncbi:ubiquitinyl hydrolase 1 [Coemansia sp. RSA 1939]|nr:ubiquitinyl hydrolase 1 [Coemansia sp. RSA 1939]KAJ2650787.1 ubiquitinyl hydrolase 1 [Coemansia sp. RSA 1285]